MPARRILQLGDPMLRAISQPVTSHARVQPVIADLRDTLHQFQRTHGFGRGISAIQIGEPVRLIYIEIDGGSHTIANPRWEWMSPETFEMWDDCFSFPNLMVRLRRSLSVHLAYSDESGRERRLEASGAFAELLQHEVDHLDGILAVDRAIDRDSLATRDEYLRRYR